MRWQSNWFKWISLDIVGYMINYMKHGFLQIHPVAPSYAHLGNWLSTRLHVESTIIDDRTLMPRKTPQSHRKKKQKTSWQMNSNTFPYPNQISRCLSTWINLLYHLHVYLRHWSGSSNLMRITNISSKSCFPFSPIFSMIYIYMYT